MRGLKNDSFFLKGLIWVTILLFVSLLSFSEVLAMGGGGGGGGGGGAVGGGAVGGGGGFSSGGSYGGALFSGSMSQLGQMTSGFMSGGYMSPGTGSYMASGGVGGSVNMINTMANAMQNAMQYNQLMTGYMNAGAGYGMNTAMGYGMPSGTGVMNQYANQAGAGASNMSNMMSSAVAANMMQYVQQYSQMMAGYYNSGTPSYGMPTAANSMQQYLGQNATYMNYMSNNNPMNISTVMNNPYNLY